MKILADAEQKEGQEGQERGEISLKWKEKEFN